MQSCNKDGTKEPVRFFTILRRLGREIDEGVKNAQEQLNNRHLDCESKHVALKGLLDRRKELDTIKPNGRTLVKELREGRNKFDQSLQACDEVLDLQLQQLSEIQTHLLQYGFVPQPADDGDGADKGTRETEAEEEESYPFALESEAKEKLERTPRLEDYGVSRYTLNMMNRPAQPAPERQETKKAAPRHDSVPDMFRNEGLTVTPSLFPFMSYGTGNRSAYEAFSLAYSPDQEPGEPSEPEEGDLPDAGAVAKTLDFSYSPEPPVLQTPGIKQIPRTGETAPPPPPGRRGPVARQLKLGGCSALTEDSSLDSPIPPVLSTPGIQQISRKSAAAQQADHKTGQASASAGGYQPMEMPKTPEFTYSLRDLEDMRVSFKQTELMSSTFSEKSAITTSSDLDMSSSTHTLAQQGRGALDGRGLPPAWSRKPGPKSYGPVVSDGMRSDQMMANLAVSEPQLSSWAREGMGAEDLNLPPSPELTMSYPTRPKAAAVTTLSSSNLSSNHQTRWGHFDVENFGQAEESYGGGKGLMNEPSGFVSGHSSHGGSSVGDLHGGVLRSKENVLLSGVQSEKHGKANVVAKDPVIPDQPVLQHPLTDGGLDLPATPKFLGSYRFMNSKR
ncbi:hypothetical protein ACOMHN_014444 [Nucella lapillus]